MSIVEVNLTSQACLVLKNSKTLFDDKGGPKSQALSGGWQRGSLDFNCSSARLTGLE